MRKLLVAVLLVGMFPLAAVADDGNPSPVHAEADEAGNPLPVTVPGTPSGDPVPVPPTPDDGAGNPVDSAGPGESGDSGNPVAVPVTPAGDPVFVESYFIPRAFGLAYSPV